MKVPLAETVARAAKLRPDERDGDQDWLALFQLRIDRVK